MRIVGVYPFNKGKEVISKQYGLQLEEILQVIESVDAECCKQKNTVGGGVIYDSSDLKEAFKKLFAVRGWINHKVIAEYSKENYVPGYTPRVQSVTEQAPYREMDFVRDNLGVEVQFGKYSLMVYDVCAKMTIFAKLGVIDCGVSIVPVKAFAEEMSIGVSFFEQFVWDLEQRGVSDIDIPLLILGIDRDGLNQRT